MSEARYVLFFSGVMILVFGHSPTAAGGCFVAGALCYVAEAIERVAHEISEHRLPAVAQAMATDSSARVSEGAAGGTQLVDRAAQLPAQTAAAAGDAEP